jgi:hypothetical protein
LPSAKKIAAINLIDGNELLDIEGVSALNLDRLDFVKLDLNEFALGHLVAASLVVFVDAPAGLLVHHLLAESVAGLPIDLVKVRLLGLAGCRVEGNGTRHQRELQVTLPVRATGGGHDKLQARASA